MPALVIQARRAVSDAEKQLAALEKERTQHAEQLSVCEAEEQAVVKGRAGLDKITAVGLRADAARKQLAQTEADIAELLERLPDLSDQLEREEVISLLATHATEGAASEVRLRDALHNLTETIREPLQKVLEAHAAHQMAVERYNELGKEAVPGYRYSWRLQRTGS